MQNNINQHFSIKKPSLRKNFAGRAREFRLTLFVVHGSAKSFVLLATLAYFALLNARCCRFDSLFFPSKNLPCGRILLGD
jgi:hypothetical protein